MTYWLALAPAGAALVLYLLTVSPTVNFLDSGELTTVAWTFGIAHPPGYPLYTLLSSAFIRLPLGNPALRMNVLSALFAALAVGLFFVLVAETLRAAPSRPPARKRRRGETAAASPVPDDRAQRCMAAAGGFAAAGLLAVSLTFWNWATQAKMYTLHFAFVAALFWLALRSRRALLAGGGRPADAQRWPPAAWQPAVRWLHALAFTAGCALANHYMSNLLWPGLALLLLLPGARARSPWRVLWRHAPTLALAALAPLVLYLYLPLRSASHPLLNWGSPDSLGDFWRHVAVWQFRAYMGADTDRLPQLIADGAAFAANQFGPWLGALFLVAAAAGIGRLWRTDRCLLAATALTAAIDIGYTLNYAIREVVVYYVPFYMMALWWTGLGVARLLAPLRRRPPIVLALGALLPLVGLAANWGAAGHRNDYTAELYVRNAFKTFRPNAIVITNSWDLASGAYYLQHVLGERPDVAVIDKELLRYPFYVGYVARVYPDLVARLGSRYEEFKALDRRWVDGEHMSPGDVNSLSAAYAAVLNGLIDTNLGKCPVYLVFIQTGLEEQDVLRRHWGQLVPDGLGFRVASAADDRATADPGWDLRGLTSARVALDEVAYSVIWIYPEALRAIGHYLDATAQTPGQRAVAAELQARAEELAPLAIGHDQRPRLR